VIHSKEQVILVDSFDREIGVEEKLKAHQLGLLHRAFSVILYRKHHEIIEVLIQKRNSSKYHSGGLWSNTCCSHPRPGENIIEAAHRRLYEELHLQCDELSLIGKTYYQYFFDNGLSEHELDYVILGYWNDPLPEPNYDEVEELKWISLDYLKNNLKAHPHHYTAWLTHIINMLDFK
jgi:isopentenyl-diphosphate delta-isomerase